MRGGTQLQTFKSVGKRTYAIASSLTLLHNSVVHVTVVAINWAGLRTVSYSEPILVDLTGPVIYNVQDGDEGLNRIKLYSVHLTFLWHNI